MIHAVAALVYLLELVIPMVVPQYLIESELWYWLQRLWFVISDSITSSTVALRREIRIRRRCLFPSSVSTSSVSPVH